MALLSVDEVTRRFGGIVALDKVSFDLDEGEIVGLIGPNGAGKTTAFNVITRLYKPDSGGVVFAGENLLAVPAAKIVRRGIARTFQNVALFTAMTARTAAFVSETRRRRARTRSRRSTTWGSRRSRSGARPAFPSERSSGSSWRAHSCRDRGCCCSMSPPEVSTTRRSASSQGCCGASGTTSP
jgi:branched-chain amino acid transport system ATP-binding protein